MATPENTKLISLTQGKFAIVNAEDYEWLMQWKWNFHKGYANRTIRKGHGNNKTYSLRMHMILLDMPKGMWCDHINGNRLDNRRGNLRICTPAQNCRNRKSFGKTSNYLGVSLEKSRNKWNSSICYNNKRIRIGRFPNELDAALAYNEAAKKYFGEFARLNNL